MAKLNYTKIRAQNWIVEVDDTDGKMVRIEDGEKLLAVYNPHTKQYEYITDEYNNVMNISTSDMSTSELVEFAATKFVGIPQKQLSDLVKFYRGLYTIEEIEDSWDDMLFSAICSYLDIFK